MKNLLVAAACLALCSAADAQENATDATTPAYAVPIETLRLSGANARLMETGSSAAGYSLIVRQGGGGWNSQVFGQTRVRYNKRFRFVRGEDEVVLNGWCRITMEWQSAFGVQYDQRTNQAYACAPEEASAGQVTLEVTFPTFNETRAGFGGFSITAAPDVDPAIQQAILRAHLDYDGVAYEALPTGFRRERGFERRVVEGYTVTRDGALVGRIDFDETNQNNRATVTIPASDADGRAAVLYLLLQLETMPDLYSTRTREEIMQF